MKGLNCRSAERGARDHCQSDCDMPVHGVLSCFTEGDQAADGITYRNAAEVIAKVAAQSQSDDTNATISKSPLVSGVAACWCEGLDRDGFC
jgi:hypothetical protein